MGNRKSIRLKHYDYSTGGGYFITILTKDRKCCLSEVKDYNTILSEPGEIVEKVWNNLTARYPSIMLDQYIVMPNHFHGIIIFTEDSSKSKDGAIRESPLQERRKMLLSKIIGYFKMNSAKEINRLNGSSGQTFWHRNYFERIIRNERELNNIREYIYNNPAKWQLDYENPANCKEDDEKLSRYCSNIWSKEGNL